MIKHKAPVAGEMIHGYEYNFIRFFPLFPTGVVGIFMGTIVLAEHDNPIVLLIAGIAMIVWFLYCTIYRNFSYAALDDRKQDVLESYWALNKDTQKRFPGFERYVREADSIPYALSNEMVALADEQERSDPKRQIMQEREQEYIQTAATERGILKEIA